MKLAQEINFPQFGEIDGPLPQPERFASIGQLITEVLQVAFVFIGILAFAMMLLGAFQYLVSAGNKEGMEKAQKRITWAIVGLIVVSISFALTQFVEQILKPRTPSPISSFNIIQTAHAADSVKIGEAYGFGNIGSFGDLISLLLPPALSLATIIVVVYFLISALQWITSGGNKDKVAAAQARITHSVIGIVLIILVFLIYQFINQFFGLGFNIF